MVFAIFDKNLNYKGLLTDILNAEWVVNFQRINTFTFEIANNELSNSRELLKLGNYVYEKNTQTMMIIEKIKYSDKDHKVYVYGYGVERLLAYRIITTDSKNLNAEGRIRDYLSFNQRGLIVDVGKLNNYPDTVDETEQKNSELLSEIYQVCQDVDMDIILQFNQQNKRFTMNITKIRDKTYKNGIGGHVFSVEYGNIGDVELSFNNLRYKTKGYCEVNEQYVIAEKPADIYVREAYLSAGVSQKEGESDEAYRQRVLAKMQKDLKNDFKAESELSADILNATITEDINVGDRITIKSETYGLMVNATVSSINTRIESGIERKTFTFMDIDSFE